MSEFHIFTTEPFIRPDQLINQTELRKFESGIVLLITGIFPNIIARESVKAREKLAKAFGQYFSHGGHNDPDASELIRCRVRHSSDYHMPPDDISRFEVGNLVALIGNTIPALFWLLFYIYSDPEVLADIRLEVWKGIITNKETTTAGEEHRRHTLDLNHIKTNCPILLSTFREVLRFHGSGISSRTVTRDHLLDNKYLLKKGSTLMIPGPVQHSDPTIWGPTVGAFDHKRFLRGGQESNDTSRPKRRTNPAAFRGFGGGSVLCPGRHFASNGVLAFAALMAVRFDVRPTGSGGVWTPPTTGNASPVVAVSGPDSDVEVEVRVCEEVGGVGSEWEILFSGTDKSMELSAEDGMSV